MGEGADSIEIYAASKNAGGNVEIREGSPTGNLLGTLAITNTGSFTTWKTFKQDLNGAKGLKDIYFVFTGGSGYLFDVNWFWFSSSSLSISDVDTDISNKSVISPNPVSSTTTIKNAANSTLTIYNINGSKKFTQDIFTDEQIIDLSNLKTGVYFAEILKGSYKTTLRLIKK